MTSTRALEGSVEVVVTPPGSFGDRGAPSTTIPHSLTQEVSQAR